MRTYFSENQSDLLEELFEISHYPDQKMKRQISERLAIPEDRITVNIYFVIVFRFNKLKFKQNC